MNIDMMVKAEEEAWYKRALLCLRCEAAGGTGPSDYCDHYNMPLYMVARKNKCKQFIEYMGEYYAR